MSHIKRMRRTLSTCTLCAWVRPDTDDDCITQIGAHCGHPEVQCSGEKLDVSDLKIPDRCPLPEATEVCDRCDGTGYVSKCRPGNESWLRRMVGECRQCHGSGRV